MLNETLTSHLRFFLPLDNRISLISCVVLMHSWKKSLYQVEKKYTITDVFSGNANIMIRQNIDDLG